MKTPKTKTSVLHIVLISWLVLSTAYIVNDLWKNGLSATYQAGYQRAFADVVANSQQCQPFNVFVGEAKADLINVACLEAAAQQAQAAQGQGVPVQEEALVQDES